MLGNLEFVALVTSWLIETMMKNQDGDMQNANN